MVKNPPVWRQAEDTSLIPGLGRYPGGGHSNPLQHSCLENPIDRGAWWATVHGVEKSRTWLSDFTFTFHFHSSYITKFTSRPMQCFISSCGINDQMPSIILVVDHSKSHERHSWTGGTSSDFLLVRAVHREGNYLLWINSVSCCYFFFSWILFPRNTISWRISGLLLLTRLGVSFSVPVQKFLSRVWTTPYVQRCCSFVKRIQCSWVPCIALS